MVTEQGRYALKIDSYIYYFNLTGHFKQELQQQEYEYGKLEVRMYAFQKSQEILKTIDLTLNSCSFNWTSLKVILKRFLWQLKTIKVISKIYLVSVLLGF